MNVLNVIGTVAAIWFAASILAAVAWVALCKWVRR